MQTVQTTLSERYARIRGDHLVGTLKRELLHLPKQLTKRIIHRFGYELRPSPRGDAFTVQAAIMAGCAVDNIIDVGAHVGEVALRYHRLFPSATIYCLEPFGPSFSELERRVGNVASVHNVGAAGMNGDRMLRVNRASYTNSLLPVDDRSGAFVDPALTAKMDEVRIEVVALDSFCAVHAIDHVSILKIDVQGTELDVLKGATQLMTDQRIGLIYLEVIFAPLYEGQATLLTIHGFLESFDYRFVGLVNPVVTPPGIVAWSDAIFVAPSVRSL